MSPRYEEDAPRPRGRKEFPLGIFIGCGVFALVIIGALIWVLINLIGTVSDAAKPNDNTDTNGVQTTVMAPGDGESAPIPDNSADGNGLDGDGLDDDTIAAEPDGSNANASAYNEAESNSTEENQTEENEDNVVYVTETVVAQ